jgi:serine/threonine protein kinase
MQSIKTQPMANSPAARRGHTESIVANLLDAGYRVVQTIGQGSAGTIFLARDPAGDLVAIKVLHPRLAGDAVPVKRFLREGGVCAQLQHPNLVRSLGAGERNGTYYMVMEYIPGETLAAQFERRGRFPEEEAVQVTLALAAALKVIHDAKLVHRDVKPSNVLMASDGVPKLGDLGLAKELVASDLTRPNQSLGTPIYMAPEQFFNAQQVDGRCDIYALGIMLYALATGELPFPGPELGRILDNKVNGNYIPPENINPNLSRATLEAINRSIQARPENRPADIDEFVAILTGKVPPAGSTTDSPGETVINSEHLIELPTIPTGNLPVREPQKSAPVATSPRAPAAPTTPLDVASPSPMQKPSPIPSIVPPKADDQSKTAAFLKKPTAAKPADPVDIPEQSAPTRPPSSLIGGDASPADISMHDVTDVDRWFLVLAKGRALTLVQASGAAVIRAIVKGKLHVNVCISRSEKGPFIPIGMVSELMKQLPPE